MQEKIRKLLKTWDNGGHPNPLKPLPNGNIHWVKQFYHIFFSNNGIVHIRHLLYFWSMSNWEFFLTMG